MIPVAYDFAIIYFFSFSFSLLFCIKNMKYNIILVLEGLNKIIQTIRAVLLCCCCLVMKSCPTFLQPHFLYHGKWCHFLQDDDNRLKCILPTYVIDNFYPSSTQSNVPSVLKVVFHLNNRSTLLGENIIFLLYFLC